MFYHRDDEVFLFYHIMWWQVEILMMMVVVVMMMLMTTTTTLLREVPLSPYLSRANDPALMTFILHTHQSHCLWFNRCEELIELKIPNYLCMAFYVSWTRGLFRVFLYYWSHLHVASTYKIPLKLCFFPT